MGKTSCELYPKVKVGAELKDSELFKGLTQLVDDREIVKYLYAYYQLPYIIEAMDKAGYSRNSQDQHNAKDVYDYLNAAKLISAKNSIKETVIKYGSKDKQGNYINYSKFTDAYNIAIKFNQSKEGERFVAYVIKNGDNYRVIIVQKDSSTQSRSADTELEFNLFNELKAQLKSLNIDLDYLTQHFHKINPLELTSFLTNMQSVSNMENHQLDEQSIEFILRANKDILTDQISRLKSIFKSEEETTNREEFDDIKYIASQIYAYLQGTKSLVKGQKDLIDNFLNQGKKFGGIDFAKIRQNFGDKTKEYQEKSEAYQISKLIGETINKFTRNQKITDITGKSLTTLELVTSRALLTLNRELEKLKNKTSDSARVREQSIKELQNQLLLEIQKKKYYKGILTFLEQAEKDINRIPKILEGININGSTIEIAKSEAKALIQIKGITDAYYDIVFALSNIDQIIDDEFISSEDRDKIKELGTQLKNTLTDIPNKIKELQQDATIKVVTTYLGETDINGRAVADIVNMGLTDTTVFDTLYSIGKVSDPIISSIGGLFREQWDKRDKEMESYSLRIARADSKLRKAGIKDTSFMYDKFGRIISDIDWAKYYDARYQQIKILWDNNPTSTKEDIDIMIEDWEQENTEERVVAYKENGITPLRTERVPISKDFRLSPEQNPLLKLNPAQKEYYDTMMQIKGEVATYLPQYAQKQFLPPQKRADWIEIMKKAPSFIAGVKAILERMKFWKLREDDTNYSISGKVRTKDFYISHGDYDNSPLQTIPIYYINRLSDQSELTHNFSTALQHFAGTAINYKYLNEIKDLVETVNGFVKQQEVAEEKEGKKVIEEVSKTAGHVIITTLKKRLSNKSKVLDGFVQMHLYNKKLENEGTFSRIIMKLLKYNSITKLGVNLAGAINNDVVGEYQMLIAAFGKQYYTIQDYLAAHSILIGDYSVRLGTTIMDTAGNNINSLGHLLAKRFDPLMENFEESSHKVYRKNVVEKLFGDFNELALYGAGESIIHYVNMYAVLSNQKVLNNKGKKVNLFEAFERYNKEDGNSELRIKEGYTLLDGSDITEEYLDEVKKIIRSANLSTHGGMSAEQKGVLSRTILGRCVLTFRQWMIETFSRRFRGKHYDSDLKQYSEGYYYTALKYMLAKTENAPSWLFKINFLSKFLQQKLKIDIDCAAHWNELTEYQKSNIRQARAEILIWLLCNLLDGAGVGDIDDADDYFDRILKYQFKRLQLEIEATVPFSMPIQIWTLLNSPFPAMNTVKGLLYPVLGLYYGDYKKEFQGSKYQGKNKYLINLYRYTIPFGYQIEKVSEMDDSMFRIFEPDYN